MAAVSGAIRSSPTSPGPAGTPAVIRRLPGDHRVAVATAEAQPAMRITAWLIWRTWSRNAFWATRIWAMIRSTEPTKTSRARPRRREQVGQLALGRNRPSPSRSSR